MVPERETADLLTREASFGAVEKVFAAIAAVEFYNFPVVHEVIDQEDALYGYKGEFDHAELTLDLKAGGYGPNNLPEPKLEETDGNSIRSKKLEGFSALNLYPRKRPPNGNAFESTSYARTKFSARFRF
ncbi:hypothetical protein A9Q96_16725 [Rhodobacterales bacterium 52_120_T64]|nr:hypothetical protein A9Q96_16725 [Rhodobacterales bacterium 52_120_T64]